MFKSFVESMLHVFRCVKLCMYRLNEGSENLRDNFLSLVCLLPINVTARSVGLLVRLGENVQLDVLLIVQYLIKYHVY